MPIDIPNIRALAAGGDAVSPLAASDVEQPNWKMAIQTHIACGERKDLEETFPEWAGANPANHDWS